MTLIDRLSGIVGPANLIVDAAQMAPYLTDWRKRYTGRAQAIVRPATTAEVAAVVRACAESGAAIVPQGGNTGLVGGATPDPSGNAVLVSLTRMNRMRDVDALGGTITIEAGCTLASVQQFARDA